MGRRTKPAKHKSQMQSCLPSELSCWGTDPSLVRRWIRWLFQSGTLLLVGVTRPGRKPSLHEPATSKSCQRLFIHLFRLRITVQRVHLRKGELIKVLRAGRFFNATDLILVDHAVTLKELPNLLRYALVVVATSNTATVTIRKDSPLLRQHLEHLAKATVRETFPQALSRALEHPYVDCSIQILRGYVPASWDGPNRYKALRELLAFTEPDPWNAILRLEMLSVQNLATTKRPAVLAYLTDVLERVAHLPDAVDAIARRFW